MHYLVQVSLDSPKYSLLIAINPNQIKNNFIYDANKNDCQIIAWTVTKDWLSQIDYLEGEISHAFDTCCKKKTASDTAEIAWIAVN